MTLTLLLDLDDTLLNSNLDAFIPAYFQQLAHYFSDSIPSETLFKALVSGTKGMYASARLDATLEQVFNGVFYPQLGHTREALFARLEYFYDQIFPTLQQHTSPRPEAVDFVEWAFAQGWNVAIATDPLFPRKAILHRLRWANLPPEKYPFRLISDFETFHSAKVSVFYYPEFLSQLGWVDGPILMVGDSIERDILPAQQAGLPAYWLQAEGQALLPNMADDTPHGTLADLRAWLSSGVDISSLQLDLTRPPALIAALEGGAAALHTHSLTFPRQKWGARPAVNEWAYVEILCHLRDVDAEVNLPRIESVLNTENPLVMAQLTDPWADEREYLEQDASLALLAFLAARKQLVETLRNLPANAWQRKARHTIFGPTDLRELVKFMVEHDRLHIQQARSLA